MTNTPDGHVSTLFGNRQDGPRFNCGTCDQTFGHPRKRHEHFLKLGHSPEIVEELSVSHYLNLRHQTFRCPVCPFKSRHAKSSRGIVNHFEKHNEFYTLRIVHICTICAAVMSDTEIYGHLFHHRLKRIPLTPTNADLNSSAASSFLDEPLYPAVLPPPSPEDSPASSPTTETQTSPSQLQLSTSPEPPHDNEMTQLLSPVTLSPPMFSQPDHSPNPNEEVPSTNANNAVPNLPLAESTFPTDPGPSTAINLFPTNPSTPSAAIPPPP